MSGFILKDFLPSYFRKKAANLATKEDIEEITQKVESIKADIGRSTHLQTKFLTEQQKLILRFYDDATEFLYEILAVNFGDFHGDIGSELMKYQAHFYKKVSDITKSYQRLVVFLPKEHDLLEIALQLKVQSQKARNENRIAFGMLKSAFVAEDEAYNNGDMSRLESATQFSKSQQNGYQECMTPIVGKFIKQYDLLTENIAAYLKPNKA